MEAIVLAGGFGTRLQHVVSDVPKPMAPMDDQGTPFLRLILDQLHRYGCQHVVLSIGYKGQVICDYFHDAYLDMAIDYAAEDMPLLTGGAVKKALQWCHSEQVFVLNGDTYFDIDFTAMMAYHQQHQAEFTLAAKKMHDFDRYGTLALAQDGRIQAFVEKKPQAQGWINGGIYCLQRDLLADVQADKFSLEQEFLELHTQDMRMYAFPSEGYFIDIGIPEDYYRAQRDFGKIK